MDRSGRIIASKDDTCILIQDWQSIDTIKKVLEGLKKKKNYSMKIRQHIFIIYLKNLIHIIYYI